MSVEKKRLYRKLYYHPTKQKFLTYTPVFEGEVVIEENENYNRRHLKKSYIMPTRRGYKFVGVLK